jgi:hypothetical protein
LRGFIIRHNRIRTDEPANRRVVVAGVVVVQAGIVQPLAGEQLVRVQRAGCGAGCAIRRIFDGGDYSAGGGGGEGGAGEVVIKINQTLNKEAKQIAGWIRQERF